MSHKKGMAFLYAHGHPKEECQLKLTGARCASKEERVFPARLPKNHKEVGKLKKKADKFQKETDRGRHRRLPIAHVTYCGFLAGMGFLAFTQPVYAATDVWTKASEIMQDVYNQIVLISTVAAIVTASVALLLMNFSRSGRTVDESRAWLKRICVTWVVLNGLGFIMAYVTPFFAGGKWTPTP